MSPVAHTVRSVSRTPSRRPSPVVLVTALLATATCVLLSQSTAVPRHTGSVPLAALVPASRILLPGVVDSNSPVVWDLVNGRSLLNVMTSVGGQPSLSTGDSITSMGRTIPVTFLTHPGDGVWMESVVVDDGGSWYGYYHNEVTATLCNRPDRVLPRIGAARSRDHGHSWEDLGIVLEAPKGSEDCSTPNRYFVGGVGDVGVMLDADATDLYLYFSQYSRFPSAQGVGVARLPWASRDEPVGRVDVWVDGIWQPAEPVPSDDDEGGQPESWLYPPGTPLVPVTRPWHDADKVNDAFWGATVHWNGYLQQYVMLLNRARDEAFTQEGIYVSFAPSLDDPARWSPPQKILTGGKWYPQVVGLEPGEGTDRVAGAHARFFMGGTSTDYIEFGYR